MKGESLRDSRSIEIGDFDNRELDVALDAIGAADLIREVGPDGKVDDHVASMLALLKHQGTFEHFAALYALGQVTTASEETWSTLIGESGLTSVFARWSSSRAEGGRSHSNVA